MKLSKKIIFAIVAAVIIGAILLTCLGMEIAFLVADKVECWRPDYEREDLSEVLEKTWLDDKDYDLPSGKEGKAGGIFVCSSRKRQGGYGSH